MLYEAAMIYSHK